MNKVQLGMFLEQNKDNLLPEDLSTARTALENCSQAQATKALVKVTKSPLLTTFFATFFGWMGLDRFYLGQTGKGIKRIIATIISIGLYVGCHFLFTRLFGNLFLIDISKMDIRFWITAPMVQYFVLAIATIFSISYFIKLLINLLNASTDAKIKNAEIFNIKHNIVTGVIDENWNIG